MNRLLLPSLAGLLLAAPVVSRVADPEPSAIDKIFAQYDHTSTPGCALGVFRGGQVVYSHGYGMADLNQGVPISPRTVFYIASTSKQFTAMSIALLAEQGKISLDDPIRKWVPELPAYADRITVRNLVHHSSGIRDYLGLWSMSGRSVADEIPEEVALDLIRRQKATDFEPGSRYSYSNSGYFLLSVIVKRASGQTLREFAQANMFGPLGMSSTHFHDRNTEIVPNRAEGYQPSPTGGFDIVRTSFAGVGDGGLLTSVLDLQRWDENFFGNKLGSRGQALIDQAYTPGHLSDGTAQTYAFGLMPHTYRGQPVVDHGGSFIGFRAELMRFPKQHFSVAVLCNDYTAAPEHMAEQVADLYLASELAPVQAPKAVGPGAAVAAERLDRWVGRYEIMPGAIVQVAREGAGLSMTAFGTKVPMQPVNDSTFDVTLASARLEFHTTPTGPALTAAVFGTADPTPRLGDAPRPSAAQLAEYAGRYRSDELDTWSVVEARGDTLRARMRWGEWQVLHPMAKDRFTIPGLRADFDRDRAGRIIGFRMSAGRSRNVGFARER